MPSSPVVTVRVNPVLGSSIFTVAPGSTAPLASLITPCSEVVGQRGRAKEQQEQGENKRPEAPKHACSLDLRVHIAWTGESEAYECTARSKASSAKNGRYCFAPRPRS